MSLLRKTLVFTVVAMFTVGAIACDNHGKSKDKDKSTKDKRITVERTLQH